MRTLDGLYKDREHVPNPFRDMCIFDGVSETVYRGGTVHINHIPFLGIVGYERACPLQPQQVRLFAHLYARRGKSFLSVGEMLALYEQGFGDEFDYAVRSNIVEIRVKELREALAHIQGESPRFIIETVRGFGYRLKDVQANVTIDQDKS